MNPKEEADETAPKVAESPDGVFGNLPSTRPGSRSPRRTPAEAKKPTAAKAGAAPGPTPAAPKPPRPKPRPKPARKAPVPAAKQEPELPAEPQEPAPGIHGVEDLAWAGVAVAAQVATVGVRFASRALETARKSVDRP